MSFFPYFVWALLGVDSLRGGLAEGNRIFSRVPYDTRLTEAEMEGGKCMEQWMVVPSGETHNDCRAVVLAQWRNVRRAGGGPMRLLWWLNWRRSPCFLRASNQQWQRNHSGEESKWPHSPASSDIQTIVSGMHV